jgi:AraC family transcriptional regulator
MAETASSALRKSSKGHVAPSGLQCHERGEDIVMKQLSKIPLVRTNNSEVLSGNPFSSVVLSSACTNWHSLLVEEHCFASHELGDLMYIQHVVSVNVGGPITGEFKKGGRFQRISKAKGAISLSPSYHPFFRRSKIDENGSADVLFVALDPVFLSQTAEALEVYPDRVELVEHQRPTDPALWHIALALRAGVQVGGADDRMYGESLSTALAVHLLREYSGRPVRMQRAHGGLSREKLIRATEYIQDQLNTDLTVGAIAQSVNMSLDHFARLFKQSTGRSPYRYVVEARAKKARNLLASGKFSIIEIAHNLGFADQSHLTRQVKEVFGTTPKMLLERDM